MLIRWNEYKKWNAKGFVCIFKKNKSLNWSAPFLKQLPQDRLKKKQKQKSQNKVHHDSVGILSTTANNKHGINMRSWLKKFPLHYLRPKYMRQHIHCSDCSPLVASTREEQKSQARACVVVGLFFCSVF